MADTTTGTNQEDAVDATNAGATGTDAASKDDASLTSKANAAAKGETSGEKPKVEEKTPEKDKTLTEKQKAAAANRAHEAERQQQSNDFGYILGADGQRIATSLGGGQDMWAMFEELLMMIMAIFDQDVAEKLAMRNDARARLREFDDENHLAEKTKNRKDVITTNKSAEGLGTEKAKVAETVASQSMKFSKSYTETITGKHDFSKDERQALVDAAIEKSTSGNHSNLMRAIWGAESNFGKSRLSPTGALGDFQFTKRTFLDMIRIHGKEMVSEMRSDGFSAEASTLENLMNGQTIEKDKIRTPDLYAQFLPLRDNPVISTYAAKHLTQDYAKMNGLDVQNIKDHADIYMSYVVGPSSYKLIRSILDKNPYTDPVEAIQNMTPERSGLSEKVLNGIKDAVKHNARLLKDAFASNEGVENGVDDRLAARLDTYNTTINPRV